MNEFANLVVDVNNFTYLGGEKVNKLANLVVEKVSRITHLGAEFLKFAKGERIYSPWWGEGEQIRSP